MSSLNSTINSELLDNTRYDVEDTFSDCEYGLKIIEESPKSKRKARSESLDTEIIANIDENLEKTLEEKAAKNNLSKVHVKNIIKQVVTNEHVLALVRQAENPTESIKLQFEPKLTRAKAKELFPTQPITNWVSPKTSSETQVLISEELPEDSSGDEYIPAEEESEDDHDSSIHSECDPPSVGPFTPLSADCSTQTMWTDDGIFKLPPSKTKEEIQDEANIALRTRSKLCLSDTPLEVIEEAFIPPDITTDMYDMDCDDDDWKNFLKQFTRPLDEVTDEDHDPEYNVLADEEIEEVDKKEELRADKGVKVTRKELNALIAELFDYADNFDNTLSQSNISVSTNRQEEKEPQESFSNQQDFYENPELPQLKIKVIEEQYNVFQDNQKALLIQQLSQHVQLLTQNFLLTFEHPEYHLMSSTFKEYLIKLKELSISQPCNLKPALTLVENWEQKFSSNDNEVKEYKEHVSKVICESKQEKMLGHFYIPTFPKYFLETVSQCPAFLYPGLLPKIPFKASSLFPNTSYFSQSEDELFALGLEQFIPYLRMDSNHVNKRGELKMKDVCYHISKYMMPCKNYLKMYRYMCHCKQAVDSHPIKYYFTQNKTKDTVHYVDPTNQMLPPCKRNYWELPEQWKLFLYPGLKPPPQMHPLTSAAVYTISPITKVTKPPVYNKSFIRKRKLLPRADKRKDKVRTSEATHRKVTPTSSTALLEVPSVPPNESLFCSTPKQKSVCSNSFNSTGTPTKFVIPDDVLKIKFNSSIFQNATELAMEILPSMPSLGTPIKINTELEESHDSPQKAPATNLKVEDVEESKQEISENESPKDNLDDINALMIASSTIKQNVTRRRLTGPEKKKAKLRRELNANLRMLSTEDEGSITEKNNRFVQAFYEKLQEQLDLTECHKVMEVLNDFDEVRGSPYSLYEKVASILENKHPELLDEFLTFFTSQQAKTMGKLAPYLMMRNMSQFLRKLELFFKDQPSQVKKIYRSLTDLASSKDVTISQVRNAIYPLLKGNALLMDWFQQIFPTEKPPDRMYRGPCEAIEIGRENSVMTDEFYETITIPEIEDPYGGPNCICSCHKVDDVSFKARQRHCVPCGTKFLQGRIFIQTGKGLRLAQVSFEDDTIDHISRLSCKHKLKRADSSPAKQISPSKDSQDETKLSSDEEPDKKQQRLVKTTRKRKPKKKILDTINGDVKKIPKPAKKKESNKKEDNSKDVKPNAESTNGISVSEVKVAVDENVEWDCSTSIESVELKLSPDQGSAESESEFCEETSQDNNTDTDGSDEESEANLSTSPEVQWTRDEDKTILETFQREDNKQQAFQKVAELLGHRTLDQIKQRFDMLINLLKEMSRNSKV